MKHRKVLRLVAAAVIAMSSRIFAAAPQRPNFLFIYTDDQRYDAMSCVQKEQGEKGRFPWFQTPNMDRIAREGLRFRNAFVVNSLCAPSRACFLTGAYNHENGVANNHMAFPADNVSHATVLRQAGYTTAYFGKWHHDNQKERPGFDRVVSFIGQGQYIDCPVNIDGMIMPTIGWIDDVTTDYAIEFLRQQKDSDKPFDMVLGFKSPHDPRTPPERAKDRFPDAQFRPVPNLESKPPYPPGNAASGNRGKAVPHAVDHFRCISAIDDCLGKILDTLDELKMAENTVVVFSSDNGYFFGEHGLGDKRAAYDESMRIPMLVRYPKMIKPGTVRDEMVLNIDLAPTFVALAGAEIPKSMQGMSWRPLLGGDGSAKWRDAFFYEYFWEKQYHTPTTLAVRTDTAKLIKYPGHDDWTELYDLKNDPYEMRNLIGDASQSALKSQMEEVYTKQAAAVDFKIPPTADQPAEK